MTQPLLFPAPQQPDTPDTWARRWRDDPEAACEAYCAENTWIYKEFSKRAWGAYLAGFKRVSGRAICEVIRWQLGMRVRSDGYRINNNAIPYLVRRLVRERPELDGLFEVRAGPPPGRT